MPTIDAGDKRRFRILKVFKNRGLRAVDDDSTAPVGHRAGALAGSAAKRALDLCLSALLLVLLSPLFLFIAIRIKCDSPGPVIYRGPRMGRGGKVFRILKFRTMHECPESYQGPRLTAHGDKRLTSLGRRLRDTKLNELPQLWNVLKGDMSLVGPRPEDPQLAEAMPPDVRQEILSVRPGITSPASVLYRDEENLLTPGKLMDTYLGSILPSKLRLDQLYVRHHSLLLDLDTLFWTVLVLPTALRARPGEESLFLGPFERFVRRHVGWFMIDALVMLVAIGVTGLAWRSFVSLDIGLWKAVWIAVAVSLLNSVVGALLGVNRIAWSRASVTEAMDLIPSLGVSTAIVALANFLWMRPQSLMPLPQPLIFTAAVLAYGGFVVVRYRERLAQALARRWVRRRAGAYLGQDRVLIVGAGESGHAMALALQSGRIGRAFWVVGFVDDDLYKVNTRIAGVDVLGKCDDIPALVTRHDIGIILFSIHNIHSEEQSRLMALCSQTLARVVMAPDVLTNMWGGTVANDGRPKAMDTRDSCAPVAVHSPIPYDEVSVWLAELGELTRAGNLDGVRTKIGALQAQLQTDGVTAGQADGRATLNEPSILVEPRQARKDKDRTRVLIVDDSEVIRARLVTMLNEIEGVDIASQAETVAQAVSALRQLKPDAMILDLRLPDGNGLDVLRLIQREQIPTAAIVLTNYPYPQYEKRARAAGAYAFLNKARDFARITDLLQTLISGARPLMADNHRRVPVRAPTA